MYLGNIVELAKSSELYGDSRHPYTKALFSAIPEAKVGNKRERIILQGDIPSPLNPPCGCHFNPRCFNRIDRCSQTFPGVTSVSGTHQYRCFNPIR